MTGQSAGRYSSAKFVVLTDSESIAKAKRNYLTWIISVTVLFGITAGFLCHRVFIAPTYFSDGFSQLPVGDNNSLVTITQRKSTPKLLFPFRRSFNADQSEFLCEPNGAKLEIIPLALRKKLFLQHYSENIYDYINKDLLVHYESIINKYHSENLKSVFNEYQQKLSGVRESADFVDFLRGLTSNKLKFYAGYLKKENFVVKLEYFYWFFALTEELNQWYNYLDRLRGFMSDYEQQLDKENFKKITETNFTEFTEKTQIKIFHFVYPFSVTEKKLNEVNEIVSEWTKPVLVNYSNCSITMFSRIILLSQVNEHLQALNGSCIKNVYVYASWTLYLDNHLELFGVSLAIVSPNWKFLKKIKINLDGTFGEEHITKTASAGQPGEPGNPGGNGGDFLGIGYFEEKFLLISTNGGVGGSGQNGAKGRDGLNNTRPSPVFDKPACIRQVKTFEDFFPLNISHYEIYNEAGCGGSGTDGGVGGQGGQGGVITLIGKNSVKVRKGLNGASGPFGKGGPGGMGGQNGCYYEAVDENDEFLHPVTTIKCSLRNILPSGVFGKDNFNNRNQVFPPMKKNLSIYQCVSDYIRFAKEHFVEYSDLHAIFFLKEFNVFEVAKLDDLLKDIKLIEGFNRIEYYEFLNEKLFERFPTEESSIRLIFNYLKSIILGKMIYLKRNINYFFVDMKSYLNIIQAGIKSTNQNTRELRAVSYFKRKILMKINRIKQNLKLLKGRLNTVETLIGNWTKYLWQEKRVSCVLLITVDVINVLMDGSNSLPRLELNKTMSMCSMTAQPTSESQSLPLIQNDKSILIKKELTNTERLLLEVLVQIHSFKKNPETSKLLAGIRDALDVLKDSNVLSEEKTHLLKALIDELEHFIALYDFIEWKDLDDLFSRSLNDLTANGSVNSNRNAEIELLKARLVDVMIAIQLKLAEDASQQNFYSMPRRNVVQFSTEKAVSDFLTQLNLARGTGDQSPFCKNHMKAVFEKNSTVGEFFSWPNSEIKNKLKALFSGAEITLKSNLINRHVLDKSFLRFSSLKLEFDCFGKERVCGKLKEILLHFKIDITHSGYSFYNWGDETHVIISEKVTLSHNFKTWDNQGFHSDLFKKCQDGEIKLSPFTTWTIRLMPINEDANFDTLAPYADIVNVILIGIGTYIF